MTNFRLCNENISSIFNLLVYDLCSIVFLYGNIWPKSNQILNVYLLFIVCLMSIFDVFLIFVVMMINMVGFLEQRYKLIHLHTD